MCAPAPLPPVTLPCTLRGDRGASAWRRVRARAAATARAASLAAMSCRAWEGVSAMYGRLVGELTSGPLRTVVPTRALVGIVARGDGARVWRGERLARLRHCCGDGRRSVRYAARVRARLEALRPP